MRHKAGFTLIEVLVALAIISIALTAVIKVSSQNIKNTFYLQEKMIALWIASDLVNEVRAGLIKVSIMNGLHDKKSMLNQQWSYNIYVKKTSNVHIKELSVDVYGLKNPMKLAHLESYLYAQ
jgi:general secretion pathway protein I